MAGVLEGQPGCSRGKDEGLAQGLDITGDLRSMCPALTLQQLYRLTEYQHDDWITGGQNSNTLGLLETIKRIVAEYVLIMFRINEHLGAIRNRGGM